MTNKGMEKTYGIYGRLICGIITLKNWKNFKMPFKIKLTGWWNKFEDDKATYIFGL
jgi:hypothetical protein